MKAIQNKICHMHDLTSREYNDLISFHAVFIKKSSCRPIQKTVNQSLNDTLIGILIGIDVIAHHAKAIVAILTGTLQVGGDTKFPMWIIAIGIWLSSRFFPP
ncbi:hypothetical protein ACLMAB_05715 [Brevibacillus laterosporus]